MPRSFEGMGMLVAESRATATACLATEQPRDDGRFFPCGVDARSRSQLKGQEEAGWLHRLHRCRKLFSSSAQSFACLVFLSLCFWRQNCSSLDGPLTLVFATAKLWRGTLLISDPRTCAQKIRLPSEDRSYRCNLFLF